MSCAACSPGPSGDPEHEPAPLEFSFAKPESLPMPEHTKLPETDDMASPDKLLRMLNKDRKPNLDLAYKIAVNIRKPEYSLRAYHDDLTAAFPELAYYMIDGSKVSSGGTPEQEYQRTIGAAFAVYWLMRIGIDGERGFCFGVDEAWRPNLPPAGHKAPGGNFFSMNPAQRRLSFYHRAPWSMLNQLMVDAGCLVSRDSNVSAGSDSGMAERSVSKGLREALREVSQKKRRPSGLKLPSSFTSGAKEIRRRLSSAALEPWKAEGRYRGAEAWKVDVERTVAMLVLTAIHDIMKVESLLPCVEARYAPYRGYAAGDRINDHDVALAFLLDFFGGELPSFSAIPSHQQRVITFTQAKIGFNHGWLVQAEAPPHALFSKFKEVITSDGASAADVAFYFVHWLTDLAGAQPAPLQGSEKFVVMFPHFVLDSFITSFPVIHRLAHNTETQVFEDYLQQRWAEVRDDLGELPADAHGVALARLVIQAQNAKEQAAVAAAYRDGLSPADKTTLCCELALTGIEGQSYSAAAEYAGLGPAFLVYYSPAFLRTVAKTQPLAALQMLAVIYRGARELWPFAPPSPPASPLQALVSGSQGEERRSSMSANGGTVTVRIDQLKDMDTERLLAAHAEGDRWYVSKCNSLEAVVVRHNARDLLPAELDESRGHFRELPIVAAFQPDDPMAA